MPSNIQNGVEQNVAWIVQELGTEPPDEAYGSMGRENKRAGTSTDIDFLPIGYVLNRMQEIFGILGFSIWCDNPIFSQGEEYVYVPVEISFALPGLFPKPLRGIGTSINTGNSGEQKTIIPPVHAAQSARSAGIKEVMRIFPAFGIMEDGKPSSAKVPRQANDDYNTVKIRGTINKGKPDEAQVERTAAEWGDSNPHYLAWTMAARDPKFSEFQSSLKYALDKNLDLVREALGMSALKPENQKILEAALAAATVPSASMPSSAPIAVSGAPQRPIQGLLTFTGKRDIASLKVTVNYSTKVIHHMDGKTWKFDELPTVAMRKGIVSAGADRMPRFAEEMRILYGLDVSKEIMGMSMIQYVEYSHYLKDGAGFQPVITQDWTMRMAKVEAAIDNIMVPA